MPKALNKFLCLTIILNLLQFVHCVDIKQDLRKLKDILSDITEYVKITVTEDQPSCVQMQCKFVCFNGKINQIVNDIKLAEATAKSECPFIDELCIYNYDFPNNIIFRGFLGEYGSKVKKLYIAASNVIDVEGGAFANGIFTKLSFEKLQLTNLRKDFFQGITSSFQGLTVIQKDQALKSVNDDFLDHVKYQIRSLTMQVGITCVRNLTASTSLLNNLQHVDFSFNDFSSGLLESTFNKLSVVEELDLSNSHIYYLPDKIFSDVQAQLQTLDLSYNQLTTISSNIFSSKPISRTMKIIATNNYWDCNCDLKKEMDIIFEHQTKSKIICSTPERYTNWSVMDNRICEMDANVETPTSPTVPLPPIAPTTTNKQPTTCKTLKCEENGQTFTTFTTGYKTTTIRPITTTGTVIGGDIPNIDSENIANLECRTSSSNLLDRLPQIVKKPTLQFLVTTRPTLTVDVLIRSEHLNSSYGLIWFSNVTKQYYKMEVNYKEYGLGCYGSVSVITTIENLLPDVAYTFCLFLKGQLTISPFSCKSTHVDGNLEVNYNAWLTRDMRATGISLVVIGIVMMTFIGTLLVFLMLKRKPTLLKGSKRIATTNGKSGEIIVFPKDKTMEDFRQKEQMLAKRNSKSTITSCRRRNSTESIDSNQSYMNANLYEIIPAYLKFNDDQFKFHEFNNDQSSTTTDRLDSYVSPLTTTSSADNLVRYAEIPSRTKRISSDPLPEIPKEQAPPPLPLTQCPDNIEDSSIEYIMTLDSKV